MSSESCATSPIMRVVAWGCITAVPRFGMLLAKSAMQGFTYRYALAGMIEAIVALCHSAFRMLQFWKSAALLLISFWHPQHTFEASNSSQEKEVCQPQDDPMDGAERSSVPEV